MRGFEDKRVGFDVIGTPFGNLTDKSAVFSAGNDAFTLNAICDGYIFQKNFSEYQGVFVDKKFINHENFREAVDDLPNPRLKNIYKTPYQFLADMEIKADFKVQFGNLE